MIRHLIGAAFALVSLMSASPAPAASQQTQSVVRATTAFLATLRPEQRAKVAFPFTPEAKPSPASFKGGMNGRMDFVGERYGQAVWNDPGASPAPASRSERSMTDNVRAMRIFEVLLGPNGYQKVLDIVGSDRHCPTAERTSSSVRRSSGRHLRNTECHDPVDARVRRSPPRTQCRDRGRSRRSHADTHGRATGCLQREWKDGTRVGAGERQGVRASRCARRDAAQTSDLELSNRRSCSRARSCW